MFSLLYFLVLDFGLPYILTYKDLFCVICVREMNNHGQTSEPATTNTNLNDDEELIEPLSGNPFFHVTLTKSSVRPYYRLVRTALILYAYSNSIIQFIVMYVSMCNVTLLLLFILFALIWHNIY